jgi:hypothetical protein
MRAAVFDAYGMPMDADVAGKTVALVLWVRAQDAEGGAVVVFRGLAGDPREQAWLAFSELAPERRYPFVYPGDDPAVIDLAFVPPGAGSTRMPELALRLSLVDVASATIVLGEAADGELRFTLADVVLRGPGAM